MMREEKEVKFKTSKMKTHVDLNETQDDMVLRCWCGVDDLDGCLRSSMSLLILKL